MLISAIFIFYNEGLYLWDYERYLYTHNKKGNVK